MKTEAEMGTTQPTAEEHQVAPRAGPDKVGASPRSYRGGTALLTPCSDSWPPELGDCKFLLL